MAIKLFNYDGTIVAREVQEGNVIEHIPAGVYKIRISPEGLVLVKDRKNFTMPEKTYGRHNYNKKRITDAYRTTKGSTGAILAGLKGSGKSLLAEDICNYQLMQDIPVFMVDAEIPESMLRMVIKLTAPTGCVFYFDEFGKIYGKSSRKSLLTFFSDSSFEKVMFIVTNNETKELDKYMIDRPGRFRFYIDYKALDQTAIVEMLDDYGLEGPVRAMVQAYVKYHHITFDMLRFIVPLAAGCTSVAEFRDEIAILNCPPPVSRTYEITDVTLKDNDGKAQNFYGDVTFNYDDDAMKLKLVRYRELEPCLEVAFDFTTATKTILRNDAFSTEYRVQVGDVLLEMSVRWRAELELTGEQFFRIVSKAIKAAEEEEAKAKKP